MKIKDLIKEAPSDLALEVELLLAYVLGERKEWVFTNHDFELSDADLRLFHAYLGRLVEGEPVEYILGRKEFYGLDFFVDKRVLLPRPETEMLVDEGLKFLANCENGNLLDIGTGSGAIPVAITKNSDVQDVLALDISAQALEVARINCEAQNVDDKIHLVQSDLTQALDENEYFDLITANLPYIGTKIHNEVADNVAKFEPDSALYAGKDGLDLYRRLFAEIKEKNIRFGLMLGEFGATQRDDLVKILEEYFGFEYEIADDLAGKARMFKVFG
jgi:release factor glutamine methyltransferase